MAWHLAQEGAHIVISSRTQEHVDTALAQLKSEGLNVSGIVCHVGNEDHLERLVKVPVEKYGGIDIFVSNAATNPFVGNMLDCSKETWNKILDVNLTAVFLLIKLTVLHMEKRGGGAIVLISSIAGYNSTLGVGPYCVSKTALLGLTKVLASEFGHMNIRVNCFAPGLIKTRFSTHLWQNTDLMKGVNRKLPLKRSGNPEECAGAVSFLCASDASYIIG
ncbi:dehydrogenase/reductase SDR family member 4-like [Protopterus annectens]|uniref:dehydrogenase/reductase SDR family member 4-like n=1 Tax=Protopterus annectens TaxID=7888 RepID=UPI001CF93B67|nr:dehydrogenase/reductase SDR family member 4-like [Protopterus annectens]